MRYLIVTLALFSASLVGCAAIGEGSDAKGAVSDPSFADVDAPADSISRRLELEGAMTFGETVHGNFSTTGYAGWTFTGAGGERVSIDLGGAGNDPMVYVYGPVARTSWARAPRIAFNDDFGGSLNSHVDVTLPRDGTYLILTREYWGDEGEFDLTLSCAGDDCRVECGDEDRCPAQSHCRRLYCFTTPCISYCEATPPSSEGRACGSRGLAPCDEGQFCDFSIEAACGAADHPGVCKVIPEGCSKELHWVCGCDGVSYQNGCMASRAGTAIASDGPCEAPPTGECKVGGCSGQLCVEPDDDGISTCEWRPQYACYATATCARQADGHCGWTETRELTDCLEGSI